MNQACFECDYKQVDKVAQLVQMDEMEKSALKKEVQAYLKQCDMQQSNPAIMAEIWSLITKRIHQPDPYASIKHEYNQKMLAWLPEIQAAIGQDLNKVLKVAIAANLIDFSAKDLLEDEQVRQFLLNAPTLQLAHDDSMSLFASVHHAKRLLYLGDNCGEIVIDRYLIECLKQFYPQIEVTYAVRGKAIVNDVTLQDADEIGMSVVARIISNGDGSLGTVLERTSEAFQDTFAKAEVVIAKGQGNYEGLKGCRKENLYFLFMSKCALVSHWAKVPLNGIVCLKNSRG